VLVAGCFVCVLIYMTFESAGGGGVLISVSTKPLLLNSKTCIAASIIRDKITTVCCVLDISV